MKFAESYIVLIVHNLKTIDFRVNYGKDDSKFIIKTSSGVKFGFRYTVFIYESCARAHARGGAR